MAPNLEKCPIPIVYFAGFVDSRLFATCGVNSCSGVDSTVTDASNWHLQDGDARLPSSCILFKSRSTIIWSLANYFGTCFIQTFLKEPSCLSFPIVMISLNPHSCSNHIPISDCKLPIAISLFMFHSHLKSFQCWFSMVFYGWIMLNQFISLEIHWKPLSGAADCSSRGDCRCGDGEGWQGLPSGKP